MKVLHTADWHIGKKLYEYDLYAEQVAAFEQIRQIARQKKVDAVVIAGDLYDRSVPSEEAVSVLKQMLVKLNIEDKLPLLAISGNHDSARRLGVGDEWFEHNQYFLKTELGIDAKGRRTLEPVELGNCQFFLVPYFNPKASRAYFEDDSISTMAQAMAKVVAECESYFKPGLAHILVGHCFVAGSSHEDSEVSSTVGGLDEVPVSLFKNFDYIVLGHLHNHQALLADNARYAGSPVKFSLSELTNQKGVYIYDTETNDREFVPLKDPTPMVSLTGSLDELCQPAKYNEVADQAFVFVNLTDRQVIANLVEKLRACYPRLVHIERQNGLEGIVQTPSVELLREANSPLKMTAAFFEQTQGLTLSANQKDYLAQLLAEIEEEQWNH